MHHSDKNIIILASVESTNNYAMGLIQKGEATHGLSIFAIEQTGGKGRRGREWKAEPGANIQVSFLTQMEWTSLATQFQLSIAAALSVTQLIGNHSHLKAFVKWPNDIFINDKKAAGILIENVIHGHLWQWAVTGIGLNINQTNFSIDTATSLSLETAKEFDVIALTQELRTIFLSYLDDWKKGKHQQWIERYNNNLYKKDQLVKIENGNRVFETTIKGVTKDGKLMTKDIFEREWNLDQVKIRM